MIPEVVKEILWTDIAKTSFRNITEYPQGRMERKRGGKIFDEHK